MYQAQDAYVFHRQVLNADHISLLGQFVFEFYLKIDECLNLTLSTLNQNLIMDRIIR
jgi:hypothetical protein